jgi:ubiquitin carboxyl-terminal hydrolase 7
MPCSSSITGCVSKLGLTLKPQVQSGGQFEIDYEVVGPNDRVILKDSKERQGDFVFTAQNAGEYRFCFSNEGYTASDKMVDFEIAVRQPPAISGPFPSLQQ